MASSSASWPTGHRRSAASSCFCNRPTIPQRYAKGEFAGGCDIVREMFETGELEQLFDSAGIAREAV